MLHRKPERLPDRHFETLYHDYSGRIYNFVLHISHGDEWLAEEITQMVFMRVWERRGMMSDVESMEAFLLSIARNVFFNHCERQAVEHAYFNYLLKTGKGYECTTEQDVDARFLSGYINALVEELPPVRRRVFRMNRLEDKSYKQISEELDISVSTVETHVALALKFIKEQLSSRYHIRAMFMSLILILAL